MLTKRKFTTKAWPETVAPQRRRKPQLPPLSARQMVVIEMGLERLAKDPEPRIADEAKALLGWIVDCKTLRPVMEN